MRRRTLAAFTLALPLAAALLVVACSESTDGVTPIIIGDATAADTSTSFADGQVVTDSGTGTDTGITFGGDSSVLLNELSPSDEWVELVATGSAAVDLTGYRVADSEKDGGGPKLDEAATFPAGTILSPRAYVIVQGGGIDAGVGQPCPDGGQSYCVNAQFGISNKDGETIYLIDPKGVVVGSVVYPMEGAASGATWGRIPNADPNGTFVVTMPTPGAPNAAE